MSIIILDIGAANIHKNNVDEALKLIDEIKVNDPGNHKIIIKAQLFENESPNVPLHKETFMAIYYRSLKHKYKCTASVFDEKSLNFLLEFEIPFIKIANRVDKYDLIDSIPRGIRVIYSYSTYRKHFENCKHLACISEYPAKFGDYEDNFKLSELKAGISDHTSGLRLYRVYRPRIWEKHIVLKHDPDNIDAGKFAILPQDLKKI